MLLMFRFIVVNDWRRTNVLIDCWAIKGLRQFITLIALVQGGLSIRYRNKCLWSDVKKIEFLNLLFYIIIIYSFRLKKGKVRFFTCYFHVKTNNWKVEICFYEKLLYQCRRNKNEIEIEHLKIRKQFFVDVL